MTKLMKLLHFLDFAHFKQVGRSVTGLEYYTLPQGPVPMAFYSQLTKPETTTEDIKKAFSVIKPSEKDFSLTQILPKIQFDESVFTPRELGLIKDIAFQFKELQGAQISKYSHLKNMPWEVTHRVKGLNKKIDYDLALDESPESISREIAEERQLEIKKAKTLLGEME